jgi:hypothetical protein
MEAATRGSGTAGVAFFRSLLDEQDISETGKVIPKHAWSAGIVRIERNKSHGLEPSNPLPFHSLLDVGAVIEKV